MYMLTWRVITIYLCMTLSQRSVSPKASPHSKHEFDVKLIVKLSCGHPRATNKPCPCLPRPKGKPWQLFLSNPKQWHKSKAHAERERWGGKYSARRSDGLLQGQHVQHVVQPDTFLPPLSGLIAVSRGATDARENKFRTSVSKGKHWLPRFASIMLVSSCSSRCPVSSSTFNTNLTLCRHRATSVCRCRGRKGWLTATVS